MNCNNNKKTGDKKKMSRNMKCYLNRVVSSTHSFETQCIGERHAG